MSIVRWFPDEDVDSIPPGQVVLVDSDAPTEAQAILEIQKWCDEHDLRRAPELHLSAVQGDGRLLRRGRCHRLTAGEARAEALAREAMRAAARQRLSEMPRTPSSVELTRE